MKIPWLQQRHYNDNHNDYWRIIVETNTVFKYNLFSTLMAGQADKQAYLLKEIESHGAGIIFPEQNGDRSVWTAFDRYERGIVASTVLFCLYMTRLSAPPRWIAIYERLQRLKKNASQMILSCSHSVSHIKSEVPTDKVRNMRARDRQGYIQLRWMWSWHRLCCIWIMAWCWGFAGEEDWMTAVPASSIGTMKLYLSHEIIGKRMLFREESTASQKPYIPTDLWHE